jgi:beta-galactosidase/beta-glucuronidase
MCLRGSLLMYDTGVTGKGPDGRIYSWYETSFEVPSDWPIGDRVLLNFGAVDYEATIFINGHNAGFHRGGYFEFTVDVTPYLSANGTNELFVILDSRHSLLLTFCVQIRSCIRPHRYR